MSCNDSLKKAYQHGYLARQEGKPRASSYQVHAWAQEWYNGWDSADVYVKSGKGITCNRADSEGGYAYHEGKPNVAPAHWSVKLRKAWHMGWQQARSVDEAKKPAPWCAPAPPWMLDPPAFADGGFVSPFAKAREDLLKLDMKVPHFMGPGKHTVKLLGLDKMAGERLLMTFITETGEYTRAAYDKMSPDRIIYSNPCRAKFDNLKRYTGLTAMPLNKELNVMNSTLAFVFASLVPDVVSVKIVFANYNQSYTYKALKSQGIAEGDTVVVDSPNGGPTVVKVIAVGTFEDLDAGAYQGYKWIVGKVDIADYTATTEKEAAFYQKVEELQRKAKAQKALEALAESLGGMDALKALMGELTPVQAAVEAPPAAE